MKIQALREEISRHLFCRDREIDHLLALVSQSLLVSSSSLRAVATLLGQGGSGRKHLIRTLCDQLERPFAVLDLSEISNEALHLQLGGIDPAGALLIENPEKASSAVQHTLLSTLQLPRYAPLLLFFSTRLGERFYLDGDFLELFYDRPIWAGGVIMEGLSNEKTLSGGLLSFMALGGSLPFSPPSLQTLFAIAEKTLGGLEEPFRERSGIALEFEHPAPLAQALTLALAPWLNAKRIGAHLPALLLGEIFKATSSKKSQPTTIRVRVGQAAGKSLRSLKMGEASLGRRLSRDLDRVTLRWQSRLLRDTLTLTLQAITLTTNTEEQSDTGTLPIYRFNRGFEHIFGQRAAKEKLKEMIALLKNPKALQRFDTPAPKGALLHGPQGVGKASLVQAFCAQMGWPALVITGSELFDEGHMALIYEQAARHAPAVVWLKDIDTKGVIQGVVTAVPTDKLAKLIAQSNNALFTLATAQELDEVPEALLDPGRLDWVVEIPGLDYEARKAFMSGLLSRPCEEGVSAGNLARYAGGMNANELSRFERRALLEAARRNLPKLDEAFLIEQINTVKYGHKLEGARLKNYKQELETTAYHEAAHAVISTLLQPSKPIEQVTAAPRAGALGFVAYEMDDKISSLTRSEVQGALAVLMAGRLAQIKAFGGGRIDSGAADDLERATALAWASVASLGLDEELGFVSVGQLSEVLGFVPFQARIEARVQHWLENAQARAQSLIEEYWESIAHLAKALITSETLEGEALAKILKPLGQKPI